MVVNEALELGVLTRGLVEDMKYALTSLQWSTFESWLQANRSALIVARQFEPYGARAGLTP